MKQYETIEVTAVQLASVVCNMCGTRIEKNSLGYCEDFLSVEKRWGYGSPYDGETHQIDLCQKCYENLIAALKMPPEKKQPEDK